MELEFTVLAYLNLIISSHNDALMLSMSEIILKMSELSKLNPSSVDGQRLMWGGVNLIVT